MTSATTGTQRFVGDLLVAVLRYGCDDGEDAAREIGAAGGDVFLARDGEGLDRGADRLVALDAAEPARAERAARVLPAGAGRVVVRVLVAAADRVVAEDPPGGPATVEAGEQRDDDEALHRHREVRFDHLRELVGLAFEAEHLALDLLVVLELGLEEAHHVDGRAGRARDRDGGEVVGREDLDDVAVGDLVALGRAPVAGHDHAVGERQREDRGALRDGQRVSGVRVVRGREGVGLGGLEEVGERGVRVRAEGRPGPVGPPVDHATESMYGVIRSCTNTAT